jgi:hypothetical protein
MSVTVQSRPSPDASWRHSQAKVYTKSAIREELNGVVM